MMNVRAVDPVCGLLSVALSSPSTRSCWLSPRPAGGRHYVTVLLCNRAATTVTCRLASHLHFGLILISITSVFYYLCPTSHLISSFVNKWARASCFSFSSSHRGPLVLIKTSHYAITPAVESSSSWINASGWGTQRVCCVCLQFGRHVAFSSAAAFAQRPWRNSTLGPCWDHKPSSVGAHQSWPIITEEETQLNNATVHSSFKANQLFTV